MKKPINILSLFDGMSCGQIALNQLGFNIGNYFASEIDKHAIKVTQVNYPNTIQLGDVTGISTSILPKIDLVIGGSPCQGFSFAGNQLNFSDPRSKLFFYYDKILLDLKHINPDIKFLLENVGMKKESEKIITDFLGVEPIEINSELLTAQKRKRLYWTNIEGVKQPKDLGIKLIDILDSGKVDVDKSYCIDASYWKGGNLKSYFEKRRRQIVFDNVHGKKTGTYNGKHYTYRMLKPIEVERLQGVPEGYTAHVANTHRYHMLGNGWTIPVIKHIFKNLEFK